jgi:hypothetical protein
MPPRSMLGDVQKCMSVLSVSSFHKELSNDDDAKTDKTLALWKKLGDSKGREVTELERRNKVIEQLEGEVAVLRG